jgi:3-hydroxy-9,10-secoandrosta-1,3,5(10)-triene-9,17-dione monooxygenase reductase component
VLGRLPTGVVVICGSERGTPRGLVCGSFMSVSLDPPLVAVSPAKGSTSWPSIQTSGAFCANVLTLRQADIARRFAASGADKFTGIDWQPSPVTGSPLLPDVAAWIDCELEQQIEAGDHWLVLGRVRALDIHHELGALVFCGGDYHSLEALGAHA